MYSQKFVLHTFDKAYDLIQMQKNKRQRACEKLDYNLKRMLDTLPNKLKQMNINEFLDEYSGNLDIAYEKICLPQQIQNQNQNQQSYQTPPKNQLKNKKKRHKKKTN